MDVSIDASDVAKLALDLGAAGAKATLATTAVVADHAARTQAGMRKDFSGHRGAPHIPRAVDSTVRGLDAEIGVNKAGPQGGLGNILAFGTSNNAPVVDHTAAQRREMPRTVEMFEALAAGVILQPAAAPEKLKYTTKSGKTIDASAAQIANWTRGG